MPSTLRVNALLLLTLALFFPVSLPGCSKITPADKKDVIAYVNKEPILRSELDRALSLEARRDSSFKVTPETQAQTLEMLINRKIIIQAAMAKGLAGENRFVNTIKAFWEQTLIRDFVDYKQREIRNYVFVTEDEIKNYYDNLPQDKSSGTLDAMRPEIKGKIEEAKETKLFDDWLKDERKKAKVRVLR